MKLVHEVPLSVVAEKTVVLRYSIAELKTLY